MSHIMIDLETMSTESNASIIAVGAVEFTNTVVLKETGFYANIDLDSCMRRGLHVSANTIYWWLSQTEAAKVALMKDKRSLPDALKELAEWFESIEKIQGVWGNGSDFDCTILGNAYKACGLQVPWKYYMNRCFRTLKKMNKPIDVSTIGVEHNALDDAIWQATYMVELSKSNKG